VVTVKYASFVTQITLKEGYPDATQQNIRIAVFNCDGKFRFLFSHIFVFLSNNGRQRLSPTDSPEETIVIIMTV
jgi:hypothetical protein